MYRPYIPGDDDPLPLDDATKNYGFIATFKSLATTNLVGGCYSFVRNCRGEQIANFGDKNPQVHLIIISE